MPRAACSGDMVKQVVPHCHAAIHPKAPPTAGLHPAKQVEIRGDTAPTVRINKKSAALLSSVTTNCKLHQCRPGGPGIIAKGSMTVFIEGRPAARVGDMTVHPDCASTIIPGALGKVEGPGSRNVFIGD